MLTPTSPLPVPIPMRGQWKRPSLVACQPAMSSSVEGASNPFRPLFNRSRQYLRLGCHHLYSLFLRLRHHRPAHHHCLPCSRIGFPACPIARYLRQTEVRGEAHQKRRAGRRTAWRLVEERRVSSTVPYRIGAEHTGLTMTVKRTSRTIITSGAK